MTNKNRFLDIHVAPNFWGIFLFNILVLARYEVGVIKSIHLLLILASKASTGKTVDCRAWPPFQTHTVKKIFEIKEALI